MALPSLLCGRVSTLVARQSFDGLLLVSLALDFTEKFMVRFRALSTGLARAPIVRFVPQAEAFEAPPVLYTFFPSRIDVHGLESRT